MALTVESAGAAPLQVSPSLTEEQAASSPTGAAPASLPDELLQIPAMQGLLSGEPAAVSANIEQFTQRPEGKLISENQDALSGAGIGLYRSLDGGLGVLFNSQYVSEMDIKNADKTGALTEIAPPFDEVNATLGQNPAAGPATPPAGPVTAPPASIGQLPDQSAAPSRAAIMRKMMNLQPQGPTQGAQPGAGRLLNSILRPVL